LSRSNVVSPPALLCAVAVFALSADAVAAAAIAVPAAISSRRDTPRPADRPSFSLEREWDFFIVSSLAW
jgi:hypothetical protein